jgi:vacuolar-type H+-ATPase subunit D/Vma8
MKSKLKGAQTGHDLLKRKSEALTKYASTLALYLCSY